MIGFQNAFDVVRIEGIHLRLRNISGGFGLGLKSKRAERGEYDQH